MPEESTTFDLAEATRQSFAAANRRGWDTVMGSRSDIDEVTAAGERLAHERE